MFCLKIYHKVNNWKKIAIWGFFTRILCHHVPLVILSLYLIPFSRHSVGHSCLTPSLVPSRRGGRGRGWGTSGGCEKGWSEECTGWCLVSFTQLFVHSTRHHHPVPSHPFPHISLFTPPSSSPVLRTPAKPGRWRGWGKEVRCEQRTRVTSERHPPTSLVSLSLSARWMSVTSPSLVTRSLVPNRRRGERTRDVVTSDGKGKRQWTAGKRECWAPPILPLTVASFARIVVHSVHSSIPRVAEASRRWAVSVAREE